MHELSIAQALVEQIRGVVVEQSARRAVSVTVQVGALSGVDTTALETVFPFACDDDMLRDCRLVIEPVPVAATCRTCGKSIVPEFPFMVCPDCDSQEIDVLSGRELMLQSVELEEQKAP